MCDTGCSICTVRPHRYYNSKYDKERDEYYLKIFAKFEKKRNTKSFIRKILEFRKKDK